MGWWNLLRYSVYTAVDDFVGVVASAKAGEGQTVKWSIYSILILANCVALFVVFNSWIGDWVSSGIAFLVLEFIFAAIIGVPAFFYNLCRGMSPSASVKASLHAVMNFISGWV